MRPPTSHLLLTSLADFLKESLAGYPFPDPSGRWQDLRVFLHNLPDAQEDGTYPFVIVRWTLGEMEAVNSTTSLTDTVSLYCGVFNPRHPAEAGLLMAELIDALRMAIWPTRVLAGRFEQTGPLKIQAVEPERQVHHYHLATIETVWNFVWPAREQVELTGLFSRKRSLSERPAI